MSKLSDQISARGRMFKLLILNGIYKDRNTRKIKVLCKDFSKFEGSKLPSGKNWHLVYLRERYNNPESLIYRELKLPTIHHTSEKLRILKNRKLNKEDRVTRNKAYYEYINSSEWINFRNQIKTKRGNRCESCGVTGDKHQLHGHHLTYVRFGKELESDIKILCKTCHFKVHQKKY